MAPTCEQIIVIVEYYRWYYAKERFKTR